MDGNEWIVMNGWFYCVCAKQLENQDAAEPPLEFAIQLWQFWQLWQFRQFWQSATSPHRRNFHRVWLPVEFVDLLFVLGLNHAALQLQGGGNFAGCDGEFIRHQHDLLDGFKMGESLVEIFHNSLVQLAHLGLMHQILVRRERYPVGSRPV